MAATTKTSAAKTKTARKRPAPPSADPETTAATEPATETGSEQPARLSGTVTFRGRRVTVVMPTDEQIDVFNRTAQRLRALAESPESVPPPERMKLLSRITRIIHAVMGDADDRDWLDDQMLDGNLSYVQACELITLAMDVLVKRAYRHRPAAGRPARARRRA